MNNKSKLVQATIRARRNVKNLAITMLPNGNTEIINMNTYHRATVPTAKVKLMQLQHDMLKIKHPWSVLLCVFGKCPITGNYWKTLDVAPPCSCLANQIENAIREKRTELINNFNMTQFVNMGWIAKPNNEEFDNDKVFKLFEELDAWNHKADWEIK